MSDETVKVEYTNTSRIIWRGPVEVCGVMLAADGADADCQVYNGESAKDEIKAHLEALSGTTFPWTIHHHVRFEKGLYIAVNAATSKVTVMFRPMK